MSEFYTGPKLTHSYTALEQFETCPMQYEAQRILRVINNAETFERSSGDDAHKSIEAAIKFKRPLPPQHAQHAWMLDVAAQIPWTRAYAEIPLALDRDWNVVPLSMNGDIPWARTHVFAKLDFLGVHEQQQTVGYLDWKFGKSGKPKPAQVEYGLLLTMLAMPSINEGRGWLVFQDKVVPEPVMLQRRDLPEVQARWMARINEVEQAAMNKDFPAKPSGLCRGWCNYTQCKHWKPKAPPK